MSVIKMLEKAMTKKAFQPMPGGQMPPSMAPMDPSMMGGGGGMPMDPSMMGGSPPMGTPMGPAPANPAMAGGMAPPPPGMGGGQVDPATGLPIDPNSGLPMDPNTGMLIDPASGMMIDPNTGMPVDPNTGMPMDPNAMGGAPMDPAAAGGEDPMIEQLRMIVREEIEAVMGGQGGEEKPSDKKPEEGTASELNQKMDIILNALGLGEQLSAGAAAPAPEAPNAPTLPADPAPSAPPAPGAPMEVQASARKRGSTISDLLVEGLRRAKGN